MNQQAQIQRGDRIQYTGDMANLPGRGTVVSLLAADQYSPEAARIILDDGRVMASVPLVFIKDEANRTPGCRFVLLNTEDREDDAEIAGLLANAATVAAQEAARQKTEAEASEAAREALRNSPEWSHLEQGDDRYSGKLAAKNIRKELKKALPRFKISVRKSNYGAINIDAGSLPDETVEIIRGIADKYKGGYFNGMEDLYEHEDSPWTDVFGGADYVFIHRNPPRLDD